MQSVWSLNGRGELLLFFSGWGMDDRPTARLRGGRFDVCTCFDYRDLNTDEAARWADYDSLTVVGWSMGVWAAGRVLDGLQIPARKAVAINGTPTPVDDARGIPSAMARATADGLSAESLARFYRRMVGGGKRLKEMEISGALPLVDPNERRQELYNIIAAQPAPESTLRWDRALISTQDAIFPPENLRAAWRGAAETIEIDAPHYPFHLFSRWEEIVGE